jgi:hypothetical protein
MLKIRPEQLEVFAKAALERFEGSAIRHLRQIFPTAVASLTDDQIRMRVRSCLPRARLHGLTTEYQVLCFVDTTYLLGEFFDQEPPGSRIHRLLADTILSPDDKANRLLELACTRFVERGRQPIEVPHDDETSSGQRGSEYRSQLPARLDRHEM